MDNFEPEITNELGQSFWILYSDKREECGKEGKREELREMEKRGAEERPGGMRGRRPSAPNSGA